ncbi:hypothetical protein ABZ527_31745 [Streptomyces griseofuscus]|uniref:hypothetical protein n=1 Tax=Streptomyces griseofuscus TaxID=146922 RepID=UPI00340A6375
MDRPGAVLLIRRLAALTGALTLASAGAAHAGGDPSIGALKCQVVKACAAVETGGSRGQGGRLTEARRADVQVVVSEVQVVG